MDFKRKLRQKAVYWGPGKSSRVGQKTFTGPVEIDCHWEDVNQELTKPTGQVWVSRATVYTDSVVKEQGVLWLGRLKDVTSRTDPFANKDNAEVQQVGKVPSVSAKQTLVSAYL